MQNKLKLLIALAALSVFLGFHDDVRAISGTNQHITKCEKRGTSGDCGPQGVYTNFTGNFYDQAWKGELKAKLDGHGSFGGSGGVGSATVCLSPGSFGQGICNVFVNNFKVGDGSQNFQMNLSDRDPNHDYKRYVGEFYANDATWELDFTVHGRQVELLGVNSAPSQVTVGENITLDWNTDEADDVTIFTDGAVGSGTYRNQSSNGPRNFPATKSGTAYFTVKACGPSGSGYRCVELGDTVAVNPAPPSMVNLNFNVKNNCGAGSPVSGASVNIDQNFGNGTSRTTDGGGFANFGVNADTDIGWSVSKGGYNSSSGTVNSGNGKTVSVILTGGCGGTPPSGTSKPEADIRCNNSGGSCNISNGASAQIEWCGSNNHNCANASSCSVSFPGGSWSGVSGNRQTSSLTSSANYTLTCTGPGGTSSDTVQVQVAGQSPPPPIVSGCTDPSATNYNSSATQDDGSCVYPAAGSVWVDKPVCSDGDYTATIRWNNIPPDPNAGYFVDVSTDSNFNTFWNKRVPNPTGATSVTALDGFSCTAANYCPGTPPGETMTLKKDKTYFTRVWAGTHYPNSSPGYSFRVDSCPTPPAAPVLSAPSVPACSNGPYSATFSWTGEPNPDFLPADPSFNEGGFYMDVDDGDSGFGSFYNKNIPYAGASTPRTIDSSNMKGIYPSQNQTLVLQPNLLYYARVFNAWPTISDHSNAQSFSVPYCALGVSVSKTGAGTGTVTSSPSGISCGSTCSANYVYNTSVTLTAVPSSGSTFAGWSGACSGTGSCNVAVTSAVSVTATFNLAPQFNYSLSNSGNSNVQKTSGNAYTQNTITKTLTSGTSQPVSLSLSGVPNGTSYSISNATCSPNCFSTITFTVTPSTPAGTYPITVTGSPLGRTTNFNLVVTGAPITVSCAVSPQTALLGQTVTWTASVSGGVWPLTYRWSGTAIPTSPAPSTNPYSKSYSTIGLKSAQATVTDSDGVQSTCPAGTVMINFNPEFKEF